MDTRGDTVHGLVERLARERPHDVFLHFEDQAFSYLEIDQASSRVAAGLQARGIARGDKVAIMLSNRPEFLFVWFGLSKLGAVEVPINTAQKGALLAYMLRQADCVAIVIEAELKPRLDQVIAEAPLLTRTIVLDGPAAGGEDDPAVTAFPDLVRNDGRFARPVIGTSDPSAIIFTSGTTGPSKGVVLPQAYHLIQGEIICSKAGYSPADRLYNALPLFHGNAQTLSTIPALMSGASMVLAKRFSASQFWDDIRRHGCTEFNYIGGILSILLKTAPAAGDGDNPLRVMIGAGANGQVLAAFESRFKVTLLEAYGMSEIGSPLGSTVDVRRPGSCGVVNDIYQTRLVDDAGAEVGPGEPGELLIRPLRANAMMSEYYAMPGATVQAWRDLWFHTGDILRSDADGFHYFVDRKKDALRRRGENISSFEVEREVNAHPAVLESAAVAVSSDLGEDEVMICVVLREGHSLTPPQLLEHCRERMAKYMTPRYIRMLDTLPKTPTERVQKFDLRAQGVTHDTFDSENDPTTAAVR